MTNIFGLDQENLADFFSNHSEKPFRAKQLLKWMHQHAVIDFQQMSNLPLTLRNRLTNSASITLPSIIKTKLATDDVIKWLCKLHDGNIIESVFIPEHNRGTLCISSQVGCYPNKAVIDNFINLVRKPLVIPIPTLMLNSLRLVIVGSLNCINRPHPIKN